MKKRRFLAFSVLLLFAFFAPILKAQKITLLQQGKPTSIRGMSVVNDSIAWISGSKGYIALTTNGGKTWAWQQVKGFEKSDFRSIVAFSGKKAIIMSSGTPALILKTIDGGINWQVKYRNADTTYFFDAMDFSISKHGFILGDPINKKFVLMETKDEGETWNMFKNRPDALPGEAAFAASGTCLRADSTSGCISIVTGGTIARLLKLCANDIGWEAYLLPIKHGKSSQGAFSIDAQGDVAVGGDYARDKETDSVACWFPITISDISSFKPDIRSPYSGPAGFQSCVEFISGKTYLSTGTSGTNTSNNDGKTWTKIDAQSFNVCRKAKHGSLVLLAGNGGKIAIFTP